MCHINYAHAAFALIKKDLPLRLAAIKNNAFLTLKRISGQ